MKAQGIIRIIRYALVIVGLTLGIVIKALEATPNYKLICEPIGDGKLECSPSVSPSSAPFWVVFLPVLLAIVVKIIECCIEKVKERSKQKEGEEGPAATGEGAGQPTDV